MNQSFSSAECLALLPLLLLLPWFLNQPQQQQKDTPPDSAPHGGKKPPLNVLSLTLVNRAFRSAMYCISFCGRDRTCLYSTDTHYIRGDRSRSIDRSWVAKKQPWKLTVLFLYSNTEILQELSDRREWLNLLCSIIQINYNYCNKLRIVLWVLCMGMIKK